ncbi:class F sortase [Nocardioides conyzicola]|uniref:Class F sortase n=1 Tax=Nocardioides conyzicola TaxID=1651781 RepID=A0ABP8WQR9_9ACTN
MSRAHRARGSSTPWRVAAAALALIGAGCLVMWAADGSTPTEGAEVSQTSAPPLASTQQPELPAEQGPRKHAAPPPQPVRLGIPGIEVSSRLLRLGLQPDGEVEVPADPSLAGWYHLGPPPGAHGTAVILGHVDSVDGPAVFARLTQLAAGDRIQVRLDDGSSVTYAVRSITTYANADFPARLVYGGTGRRELNLVTCGGAYDSSRGGYQSNVVVNARWVSGTRS